MVEPLSFHQFIESGLQGAQIERLLRLRSRRGVWPDHRTHCLLPGNAHTRRSGGSGRAATYSVVLASLFVILADVVLVKFILVVFP